MKLHRALLVFLLVAAIFPGLAVAADLSNPLNLMFVADAEESLIDIIDLRSREVVARIETKHPVDDLVATPFAPVLIYTNIERNLVSLYDLREQRLAMEVELPMSPRHMVLDSSGSKIGFSDSVNGGFVLFSAYSGGIIFELEDFPPSRDVLFDPNEIEIFYTNNATGSLGMIDSNLRQRWEMQVAESVGQELSAPSRSLDGRYVYVANEDTGEVYSINTFSKVVHSSFNVGDTPVRPYTTPEGGFLYLMDKDSGRFMSVEQNRFEQYVDTEIGADIDLVTVGRFDRMNLFMSTENQKFYLFDNISRNIVESGTFEHRPIDALGSIDGRTAFVAFRDSPTIAFVDLESNEIEYVEATNNGAGAFAIGLSNNVCH